MAGGRVRKGEGWEGRKGGEKGRERGREERGGSEGEREIEMTKGPDSE